MKSNTKKPKELENTYDPDNEEFDITTDEDMMRWRADEIRANHLPPRTEEMV